MRSHGRDEDSLSASPPPPRQPKGSLSSMVVLPDAAGDGAGNSGEIENGEARSRTATTTPHQQRIGDPVPDDDSPTTQLSDLSGYGTRAGSLSPLPQQKSKCHHYDPDAEDSAEPQRRCQYRYLRRPENHHYDADFDQPGQDDRPSPHLRRTPHYHRYDRGYEQGGRPRGRGSRLWQRCGNLNFARREYCNKCNKFRFGDADGVPAGASPRRSCSGPASPHGSPPSRFSGPPHDRGLRRRDANSYRSRSPSHGWARGSPRGPPLQRGKSTEDYYEDDGLRGRDRFDRTASNCEGKYEFIHGRSGYDPRPPSPSDRWEDDPRRRSRSPPPRARSPRKEFGRSSHVGRGRGDRRRTWQA